MGRDKSRLLLGEQTFAEIIARTLFSVTGRVKLIGAAAEDAASAGDSLRAWPHAADAHFGCGPLAGVHTALSVCRRPWAVIVACDLPFITAGALRALATRRVDYEAVVPLQNVPCPNASPKGASPAGTQRQFFSPQPLCALYAREPCLEVVTDLIDAGERRAQFLAERVRTYYVEESSLGGPTHLLFNINTLGEYEAARRLNASSADENGAEKFTL